MISINWESPLLKLRALSVGYWSASLVFLSLTLFVHIYGWHLIPLRLQHEYFLATIPLLLILLLLPISYLFFRCTASRFRFAWLVGVPLIGVGTTLIGISISMLYFDIGSFPNPNDPDAFYRLIFFLSSFLFSAFILVLFNRRTSSSTWVSTYYSLLLAMAIALLVVYVAFITKMTAGSMCWNSWFNPCMGLSPIFDFFVYLGATQLVLTNILLLTILTYKSYRYQRKFLSS